VPQIHTSRLALQPRHELLQCLVSVGDLVLFGLVHLRVRLPLVLEDRIESKTGRPSRRHYLAISPALEDERLVARACRVGKGAHGLGGFVVVGQEQIVQPFQPDRLEEPFPGSETTF